MKDHVIICGLGSIGFRTFQLLKSANQEIVAISDTTQDEWRWQVESSGGTFILGDARDDNVLIKAGIKDAKAILGLTDQDMVNVSIAMDARRLNPTIRIILRMFDNELGAHISNELGIHQVFSTSELVAPIFASSIFDSLSIAKFKMNDEDFFVSEDVKDKSRSTLSSFVLSDSDGPVRLIAHSASYHKKRNPGFHRFINKFNYLLSPVFANFRQFLFILLCVIVASAFFLKWAMSLSFIDALYFVTTTVTTVGYGDFNFSQTSIPIKIFGCLLMLSGASALAILFSSITEIILSKKLPSILGGRPVPKEGHVIVVGSGLIGRQLISILLEEQLPVVIIEESEKGRYSADINRNVALVHGFLRSPDTLISANIHSAKAIVVITDDDVENLSVSMAARKLNSTLKNIIHVFSPKLGEKLKTSLSLDTVLCLPKITAPYFAAAVFGENILLALEWRDQLIYLSQGASHRDANGVMKGDVLLRSIPIGKIDKF